jgi:hypothetical protein
MSKTNTKSSILLATLATVTILSSLLIYLLIFYFISVSKGLNDIVVSRNDITGHTILESKQSFWVDIGKGFSSTHVADNSNIFDLGLITKEDNVTVYPLNKTLFGFFEVKSNQKQIINIKPNLVNDKKVFLLSHSLISSYNLDTLEKLGDEVKLIVNLEVSGLDKMKPGYTVQPNNIKGENCISNDKLVFTCVLFLKSKSEVYKIGYKVKGTFEETQETVELDLLKDFQIKTIQKLEGSCAVSKNLPNGTISSKCSFNKPINEGSFPEGFYQGSFYKSNLDAGVDFSLPNIDGLAVYKVIYKDEDGQLFEHSFSYFRSANEISVNGKPLTKENFSFKAGDNTNTFNKNVQVTIIQKKNVRSSLLVFQVQDCATNVRTNGKNAQFFVHEYIRSFLQTDCTKISSVGTFFEKGRVWEEVTTSVIVTELNTKVNEIHDDTPKSKEIFIGTSFMNINSQ